MELVDGLLGVELPSAMVDLIGDTCTKDPLEARGVLVGLSGGEPPSVLVDLIGDMFDERLLPVDKDSDDEDRDGGLGALAFSLVPRPSSLTV